MLSHVTSNVGRIRAPFARLWAWVAHLLLGDDVFASYSRQDGASYVLALANGLSDAGFVCYVDQWGSAPGLELPTPLRRTLLRSSMLVVVGSPGAAQSENVEKEIRDFHGTGRSIVVIDVDGAVAGARWRPLVDGVARISATGAELASGTVSPAVNNRVERSANFTRRTDRQRRLLGTSLTVFAVVVGASILVSSHFSEKAREQAKEATLQTEKAHQAETRAAEAAKRAQKANDARAAVEAQRDEVQRQITSLQSQEADAVARAGKADKRRRDAEERVAEAQQESGRLASDVAQARQESGRLATEVKQRQNNVASMARAAEARAALPSNPTVAMELALQSFDLSPTPQSVSALRAALSEHVSSMDRQIESGYMILLKGGAEVGVLSSDRPELVRYNVQTGALTRTSVPGTSKRCTPIARKRRIVLACEGPPDFAWDGVKGSSFFLPLKELAIHHTVADDAEELFATPGASFGTADGKVLVWTTAGMAKTTSVPGHVEELAFLHHSRRLIVGVGDYGSHEVLLFDVQPDGSLKKLESDKFRTSLSGGEMIVHPLDRQVALVISHELHVWTLPDLKHTEVMQKVVESADYNPDGSLLAVGGSGGEIHLLSTESFTTIKNCPPLPDSITDIRFSPRYPILIAGTADTVPQRWTGEICDTTIGADIGHVDGYRIGFTADGLRILTRRDNGLRLSEPRLGYIVKAPKAVGVPENISPDGLSVLTSGRLDGLGICLWHWKENRYQELLSNFDGANWRFSRDGSFVVVVDSAGQVDVWKTTTEARLRMPNALGSGIKEVAVSAGGNQVAVLRETNAVEIWDVERGARLAARSFPGQVIGIEFASSNAVLNVADGLRNELLEWSWASGVTTTLVLPGTPVLTNAPEDMIVTEDRGHTTLARIHRDKSGNKVVPVTDALRVGKNPIWSADGRFLVGSTNMGVAVYDGSTGDIVWRMSGKTDDHKYAAFIGGTKDIVWVPSIRYPDGPHVRVDRCEACRAPDELVKYARARLAGSRSATEGKGAVSQQ
jgi:WD40 repeat protein